MHAGSGTIQKLKCCQIHNPSESSWKLLNSSFVYFLLQNNKFVENVISRLFIILAQRTQILSYFETIALNTIFSEFIIHKISRPFR